LSGEIDVQKEKKKIATDKKKMIRVITFLKEGMDAITDSFDAFSDTMKEFSSSLKRAQKDLKGVVDEESLAYYSADIEIESGGGKKYKKHAANTLAQLLFGKENVEVSTTSTGQVAVESAPKTPTMPSSSGPPTQGGPPSRGGPPTKAGPPSSGAPTSSGPPTKGGPPSRGGPPTKAGPPPPKLPPTSGAPKTPTMPKVTQGQISADSIRNEMLNALGDLKKVFRK